MLSQDVGGDAGEAAEVVVAAAVAGTTAAAAVALWALVPAAVAALYEDLLFALVLASAFCVGALFAGVDRPPFYQVLSLYVRARQASEENKNQSKKSILKYARQKFGQPQVKV